METKWKYEPEISELTFYGGKLVEYYHYQGYWILTSMRGNHISADKDCGQDFRTVAKLIRPAWRQYYKMWHAGTRIVYKKPDYEEEIY